MKFCVLNFDFTWIDGNLRLLHDEWITFLNCLRLYQLWNYYLLETFSQISNPATFLLNFLLKTDFDCKWNEYVMWKRELSTKECFSEVFISMVQKRYFSNPAEKPKSPSIIFINHQKYRKIENSSNFNLLMLEM